MNPALAFYGRPKGPPQKRKSLKALKRELRAIQKERSDRAVELAHHEAGHIVVAMSVGFAPSRVRLGGDELRDDDSAGKANYFMPDWSAAALATQQFLVAAAGPIAQRRAMPAGERPYDGMRNDFDNMRTYVNEIFAGREDVTEDEIQRKIAVLWRLAEDRVTKHWPAIVRVALELAEKRVLEAAEIKTLVDGATQEAA